jgi:hypothetical protein
VTAVDNPVLAFLNSPLGAALGFAAGTLLVYLVAIPLFWWWDCRRQQCWRREETLRWQLRELEDQIWRESLPDWQREAMERADQKRAEIKREARRRLGLPEEERHR